MRALAVSVLVSALSGCAAVRPIPPGSAGEAREEAAGEAPDPAPAPARVGWWTPGLASHALEGPARAAESAREELARLPLELVTADEIRSRLSADDAEAGRLAAAEALLDRGRELQAELKLKAAAAAFGEAADRLAESFVRFYNPELAALPHLQLGVVRYQARQQTEAWQAFQQAARLAPDLELPEGYYSPRVRRAYRAARAELGEVEPAVPRLETLEKICAVAGLAGLLLATGEALGDRPLLRLALFDPARQDFTAVETAVLEPGKAPEAGRGAAARIQAPVAALAGVAALPPPPPPGAAEPPPPAPWYREHWWIWPVAGVVLGGAILGITLPLTVYREDVVDVRVHY